MKCVSMFLGAACGLLVLTIASAANAQVKSGPEADSRPEPLKVFVATGDDAGKDIDYQPQLKEKPSLVVFVQAASFTRPVARFLKALDDGLAEKRNDVSMIVVWLTDDVDKGKNYLPRAQQSLQLRQTVWTVFPGDASGPEGWGINSDADATAVVIEGGKVVASHADRSVNETSAAAVLKSYQPRP